ncbi:MAG: hypothetical protein J5923_06565 [Acidaminococcaceae bacterium]|uniref:hypothetical protein n=1 Tax=Succiniclasticum sp. TaxID=2775030 RepID=UPI000E88CB4C|nr:hypothetical protein [Succiniclasticum sp.]MBO5590880.1 hypothetical protein [Acidaminococcaceae bacterium]MBR1661132.1 hypothetical protein [Acidaminococcaceae bacterium]MDY6292388.1 hypothetical protein [Succiniclasticum sp.]HAT97659.1 hypothetical protein [Acidaminococcaceae bacterium]
MAKRENKFAKVVRKEESSNENFGLGRPFDFDDWFNRIAIMGTLVSTIILLIFRQVTGSGTGSVMTDSVSYAAGFFFAYLIGREVDPEPGREWGALLGAFITLALEAVMGVDIDGVIGLLWVLFICRMFNRTSGSRHRIGDNAIILGSAFWMGYVGYWLFPIITGICYILESQIREGYYRSLYLSAVAFAMCAITGRNMAVPVLSVNYLYLMGIAFILFLPELTMAGFSTARDDRNQRPLIKTRLQCTQGMFLIGVGLLIYFGGNSAGIIFLPCIGAAIGTGLYLLVYLLKKKQQEEQGR